VARRTERRAPPSFTRCRDARRPRADTLT